jgi:fibronectin-binding autotransporter adhesin
MNQIQSSPGNRFVSVLATLLGMAALGLQSTQAANVFWDVNGATAGTGATPNGTWDGVNVFWSTTSAGNVAPGLTTVGAANDGFFSAGTDAIGIYNVTVSGTQLANSLTFQEGTPTLTGGTVQLTKATSSSGLVGSIVAASTLNGTATVSSTILVNTTGGGTSLLKLIANNGSAATDLLVNGPIATTSSPDAYSLRLGGAGSGRIATSLAPAGVAFGGIQQGNTTWSGTWTVAGNQTLGNAAIQFGSYPGFGAGAKLVMGDSAADNQTWGSTLINNANAQLIVNSTAFMNAGLSVDGGSGGSMILNGSLDFATTFGITVGSSGQLTLNNGSALTLGIGTIGLNGAIAGTGTAFLDCALTLDLSAADLTSGNSWTVINTGTLNETFGENFSLVGFSVAGPLWSKTDGLNQWTFNQDTGILNLTVVPEPTAATLLLGGIGALMIVQRRRSI